MIKIRIVIFAISAIAFILSTTASAQTTEFVYQGQLQSSSALASGNFDFEFLLFDAPAGGSQIGATLTKSSVAVANGIFSVNLDFGSSFPGASRYLEIHVRQAGGGVFTSLAPRQSVSSAPYAVKSLNADSAINAVNATNATNAGTATTAINANNAVNATNATTATTAVNFSGTLAGDVTGTQGATTIANNAVTTAKLADGSVTNAKIADVAGSKITGSISTATIPGANVIGAVASATNATNATNAATANGLSASCVGCVTNGQIGSVDGAKVTGTVANATNATNAANATNANNATNATTATNANQLGGVAASQYLQTNGNGSALTNLNAASVTTGTLSNARLGQIPTANIADSAVTAPKIATGQVVKSLNALTENVTLAAGSNITITPTGNTLTIASTGGGNAILNQTTQQAGANFNISGNGLIGGSVGIGTGAPASALEVRRNATVASDWQTGQIRISGATDPNMQLNLGYDTTANSGVIQAGQANTSYTNLFLNPFGGSVAIGLPGGPFTIVPKLYVTAGDGQGGVAGSTTNFPGVRGVATTGDGVVGESQSGFGVHGSSPNGTGVFGSSFTFGVKGSNVPSNNFGAAYVGAAAVWGTSQSSVGVFGTSDSNVGVVGVSQSNIGVLGRNTTGGTAGRFEGNVIVTGTLTQNSDARLKRDISKLGYGLREVLMLRPVSWTWKEKSNGSVNLGLIAQEVEKVLPELVSTDKDPQRTKGINYIGLAPVIIRAIQEQQKQIEKQNAINKNQESEIGALKSLVCRNHRRATACKSRN